MEISPAHMTKRTFDSKTPSECLTAIPLPKPNQVGTVLLYGIPIVSLFIDSQERLCLAQISNTLLKQFSYNEIHNRRVALGITCIQCTPVQLEILRRAGAMPVSSRRCGMITRREAERLCKSFLGDNTPPRLPEDFAFAVHHECAWGCRGSFLPSRYNSSRAKCIKCSYCGLFFSPNKFIFHSHRMGPNNKYVQPDAANFNSWRRHMKLSGDPPEEVVHAWEDVKAMFNGGTRKRLIATSCEKASDITSKRVKDPHCNHRVQATSATTVTSATTAENGSEPVRPSLHSQVDATNANRKLGMESSEISLNFSRTFMMDYMWHAQSKSNSFQFSNIAFPWIKRPNVLALSQNFVASEDSSVPPKDVKNFEQLSNCSAAAVATAGRIAMLSSNCVNSKLTSFCNNSAFKPVLNSERSLFSSNIPLSVGSVDSNEFRNVSRTVWEDSSNSNSNIKESLSSDDEMVDIETTEEEEPKIIDENFVSFKSSTAEQLAAVNIEKQRNPEMLGFMKKEVFEHSSFHY